MISQDIANTIVDPRAYAEEKPIDEAFAYLRKEAPFAKAQPEGFDPFWVVTKHADILEVERQNDLFHNGDAAATLTPIDVDRKVRELMGGSPHLVRSLVQMDNPDHMAYRRLTQAWFLPQNLKKLDARIRDIAKVFIDRMADMGGECDFAKDVALYFPLHVIMEVLGVPEADEPRMLKLTQELFGSNDPDLNRAGKENPTFEDGLAAMQATIGDFITYFNAMTEDRRANPREDLSTVIANGQINGQPLDHFAAMSYYIIAATAGHDTTSNTTASGLWALIERQDQLKRLQGDLSLIPSFMEETIRWATPVKHFMRSATADAEVRGQKIAKGDWMMLCYPSGNRDEEVFDKPFEFRIDRTPNKQLAFGYGAHVCIGQHLARMEMRIFWEELLSRLKSVEFAGTPKLSQSNFVCGPKSIPIRYKMN
ncbi:MAG: cytochrome P450 [Parvibaculum sp.]|jgi:cytochrome P450|uniref:cytochrome P450 n=1 Tax=Parvibaculum sp. TaxID=2024848 RepID=UPI0028517E4B|nr:cytochrome P450 [Parvibaculum sp.]MDR3500508.1 cytochrome P450 [Parvibaculum sp.]